MAHRTSPNPALPFVHQDVVLRSPQGPMLDSHLVALRKGAIPARERPRFFERPQ